MPMLEMMVGTILKQALGTATTAVKDRLSERRQLVRAFIALYDSLDHCQYWYLQSIETGHGWDIEGYDRSLRVLIENINALSFILRIKDIEVLTKLETYTGMEVSPDPARAILQELKAENIDQTDYLEAKQVLSEFMKNNFSMEDLFLKAPEDVLRERPSPKTRI